MSIHDEDVLGKAYDARLMRRLLVYLRPYRRTSCWRRRHHRRTRCSARAALPDQARRSIATFRRVTSWPGSFIAALYLASLAGSFVLDYVQTWLLQLTGQRIMFDLRMRDLRAPAAARPALLRPESGRPADDARHDRRRRPERPVHVRRRVRLRRLFTLVGIMAMMIWIDWRLAIVAFSVLPLIWLVTQWFRTECARVVPHGAHLDRPNQRVPAGAHHRHGDGAAVPARGA